MRALGLWQISILASAALFSSPALAAKAVGTDAAVVTDSRHATSAALQILRQGGSAADGAVAAAFVLAALEGQACNLGGGGALLHYERDTGLIRALNFLGEPSNPEFDPEGARYSSRVVVPRFLDGLAILQKRFGRLDWQTLLRPARTVASELRREDLASLLDSISKDRTGRGRKAVKERLLGWSATQEIALARRDFDHASMSWEAPIRIDYGSYEVWSVLPPGGGGLVLAETLGIMAGFDLGLDPHSTRFTHLVAKATATAMRDNASSNPGPPATSRIPVATLLSREHLARARQGVERRESVIEPMAGPAMIDSSTIVVTDSRGDIVTCVCARRTESAIDPFRGLSISTMDSASKPLWTLPMIILDGGAPWVAGGPGDAAHGLQTMITILFALVGGVAPSEAVAAPRFHWDLDLGQLLYEKALVPIETIDELNRLGLGALPSEDAFEAVNLLVWSGEGPILALADPRGEGAAGGF